MSFCEGDFVLTPSSEIISSGGGGGGGSGSGQTSLRLASAYYCSKNSDNPPPPADIPPPLRWFLPSFFNGVEDDDVDTTLRLCPPGTVIHHEKSKKSDRPLLALVYNPTPLRWFRPQSNGVDSPADDVDQNQADTIKKSRNNTKKKGRGKGAHAAAADGDDDQKKKKKIRWDDAEASTSAAAADGGDDDKKKRRRRRRDDAEASTSAAAADSGDDQKKKKRRRRNDEDQRPFVPIEEIGGLQRAVESRGGSRPEFLYKKKLHDSDVKRSQNRVFLSRGGRVMEFLREEEASAVDGGGEGLTIVGVDGGGKVYENLVMTKWASLKMIVIKSDWMKVVDANKAEEGHVMEIWGFRENDKPCLAFNFRRDN